MTLRLKTESHGEIEAGFFGIFTQFFRFGEYTFATRHLCELVEYLANNPQVLRSQIIGYNLDRFWQRRLEDEQRFAQMSAEAWQSALPELQISEMERQSEHQQGHIPVQDEVDLYNQGRMVPVIVSDDEKLISIEDYCMEALHFGRMAVYLTDGGLVGWLNGQIPEFAESASKAIRHSKRELYRKIREELSS